MTENPDLLACVLAAPGDDAPRLVYADWLMEQRDPRGEFISLQCETARRSLNPYLREEHRGRIAQLLESHEGAWAAPAAEIASSWTFRRGFLDEVHAKAKAFLAGAGELFQVEPIRRLALESVGKEHARKLAAASWLGRITHLVLQGSFGDDGTTALAHSPHIAGVISLNLAPEVGPRGAEAIAASPHFRALGTLSLTSNSLGDDGAAAIARAPLPACTALHLSRNEIGDAGVIAIAGSEHLVHLTRLSLNFNEEISDKGAIALARSPHLTRLRRLELEGTNIGKRGKAALLKRFPEALI